MFSATLAPGGRRRRRPHAGRRGEQWSAARYGRSCRRRATAPTDRAVDGREARRQRKRRPRRGSRTGRACRAHRPAPARRPSPAGVSIGSPLTESPASSTTAPLAVVGERPLAKARARERAAMSASASRARSRATSSPPRSRRPRRARARREPARSLAQRELLLAVKVVDRLLAQAQREVDAVAPRSSALATASDASAAAPFFFCRLVSTLSALASSRPCLARPRTVEQRGRRGGTQPSMPASMYWRRSSGLVRAVMTMSGGRGSPS